MVITSFTLNAETEHNTPPSDDRTRTITSQKKFMPSVEPGNPASHREASLDKNRLRPLVI